MGGRKTYGRYFISESNIDHSPPTCAGSNSHPDRLPKAVTIDEVADYILSWFVDDLICCGIHCHVHINNLGRHLRVLGVWVAEESDLIDAVALKDRVVQTETQNLLHNPHSRINRIE